MLHGHKLPAGPSSRRPSLNSGSRTPRSQCISNRQHKSATRRGLLAQASSQSGPSSQDSGSTPSVSVADPQQLESNASTASSTATGSSSAGPDKSALLARIAAAKAYKSGSSSGSGTTTTTSSSGSSDAALTDEQQEAMRQQYLQQLQQQQQELAAQNNEYNSFLQSSTATGGSSGSSGRNALDRLAQEDQGWGPGSKTGPARSDFYTSADAPAVQQLLGSAPRRTGMGSADQAADWLQGVLADKQGRSGWVRMRGGGGGVCRVGLVCRVGWLVGCSWDVRRVVSGNS